MENQFPPYKSKPNAFAHPIIKWNGNCFIDNEGSQINLKTQIVNDPNADFDKMAKEGISAAIVPISWKEAEKGGEGKLDHQYIAKIEAIMKQLEKTQFFVLIKLQHDMPKWTYAKVGLDKDAFDNHRHFMENTMHSLFCCSEILAPALTFGSKYGDVYFLNAFCRFIRSIARTQKEKKHIIGYQLPETLDFGFSKNTKISKSDFEKIKQASGNDGAWKQADSCIWKQHGAWGIGKDNTAKILLKKFFSIPSYWKNPVVKRFHEKARIALLNGDPKAAVLIGDLGMKAKENWPYPRTLVGTNYHIHYNPKTKIFQMSFKKKDVNSKVESKIFLPEHIYGKDGFSVSFTGDKCKFDEENAVLSYFPGQTKKHKLTILPKIP